MKSNIILLIEDGIVNVKFIDGLSDLGIDASLYCLNSPTVIFKLIGINESVNRDELYGMYFEWLRDGKTIDFSESRKELKNYAEKVYFLLKAVK